eukprot:CAMPEP_0202691774 /NCGR_PEP_ID=MMETSP1385-20130828/6389_1 /ASSEMBLY_ACC=CAM_ASM_000861 /TAXON_ID=933848 /ORGANISM="Elphidium margaritaceum" /LENGTH=316 /DNA_ID=CAMNT_0049347227 /DNA_START=126 /DNA_END=1076 /DNA_ORIENTATION=-
MANLQEMQRQLRELADKHKKAKLQALFSKQDELRPFSANKNDASSYNDKEIEAMQSEFNTLSKGELERQYDGQFLLRMTSRKDITESDQPSREEAEEEAEADDLAQSDNGSGEQKIDAEDMEAMQLQFDQYQKKLLNTQIEKSFRFSVTSTADDRDDDLDLEEDEDYEEPMTKEEEQEKEKDFCEMQKMLMSYRSTKMLESVVQPQIKPKHREQFNMLMRDIGIVNQTITSRLWRNIEGTVLQAEDRDELDELDDMENEPLIAKLQKQNKLLQQQLERMQRQLSPSLVKPQIGSNVIDELEEEDSLEEEDDMMMIE